MAITLTRYPITASADWVAHYAEFEAMYSPSSVETIRWAQVQANSGFNHRTGWDAARVQERHELFTAAYPEFEWGVLAESPYSLPASLGWLEGRLVSSILYWHLAPIACLWRHLNGQKVRIAEIGPGIGELARLAPLGLNVHHYTLIDFPESLRFARTFLDIHSARSLLYRYMGVDQLPSSHPCEVVIDQGSMAEMPAETINEWCRWMDDSEAKAFYSLHAPETPITLGWPVVHEVVNPAFVTLGGGTYTERLYMRR